jgi:hypothetical protein
MMTITTLKSAVLALLLQTPPHWSDIGEDPAARADRLSQTAVEVAMAALYKPTSWRGAWPSLDIAAALVNLGKRESQWARYVADGCHALPVNPDTGRPAAHCDHGRARSYWQVWAVGCPALVTLPRGAAEEPATVALCAARLFASALIRCRATDSDPMVGAYAGYRSRCTVVSDTRDRARTHYLTKTKLRAAVKLAARSREQNG